ncbi:MAG: glutamate 5-kinase [Candidatus Nitrohelix vancouverensis]|uniref:Glutamate 5-kinase n=1 Tax=Candidatus Nitrohelix vancouverensis TaxID=2705534 RepID=A0A7T0G4H5_9BACT|nr:MAG: glutamate 5-kinase [Candidatus Nitrohelix vancouverensis]
MSSETRRYILNNLKRVVIKIGSSVISHQEPGKGLTRGLSPEMVLHYARKIKMIAGKNCETVLVSSGAIMAGRERLGLARANLTIPEKQACAAIGQSFLMHTYEKKLEKQGMKVAQILLSHDDLGNRRRYLNAKHTIETLIRYGAVPIINENDTVTVDEIKIGDNDTLSATVACLVDAQALIILSDVEGLYTRNPMMKTPKGEAPPELISQVDRVTEDVEKLAGKTSNRLAVGGMYTKVLAAKKTMSSGIPTFLLNGLDKKILDKFFKGEEVGTLFWSDRRKIGNRKHWIAHTLKPQGRIFVDAGAEGALLQKNKSLLPAGVVRVEGSFEFGNSVSIVNESNVEIARGLVNYSTRDLNEIKGKKTADIRQKLGDNFYEEVVHRDDLALLE